MDLISIMADCPEAQSLEIFSEIAGNKKNNRRNGREEQGAFLKPNKAAVATPVISCQVLI